MKNLERSIETKTTISLFFLQDSEVVTEGLHDDNVVLLYLSGVYYLWEALVVLNLPKNALLQRKPIGFVVLLKCNLQIVNLPPWLRICCVCLSLSPGILNLRLRVPALARPHSF